VRDRERKSELKMLVVDGRLEAEFCSVLQCVAASCSAV